MTELSTFRVSQPRRTRTLSVKQSRSGCRTCKNRRVKCDETKPICQRCERANRPCEYGTKLVPSSISTVSRASSNPAFSQALNIGPTYEDLLLYDVSPAYALSDTPWHSPEQSRLASLGCWVLSNDPMIDRVAVPNSSVWLRLLPRLVHSTRSAYTSAAAFGAVYESCLISVDRATSETQASLMYSNALSVLQEELTIQSAGTASLLISCILLACVEVVQRRRANALRHLEGAFKVLEMSDDASLCLTPATTAAPSTDSASSSPATTCSSFTPKKNDLFLLLKTLDLQTSTYALARTPYLPVSQDDDPEIEFRSVRGADLRLIITLHNVHHFTSRAAEMKYLPPASIPRESSIEQGRHIARLSLWLKCLDANILYKDHDLSPPAYRHALMLRAQCLIAIIYTSAILCPYETEYDRHASSFQQIIEAAEVVVDGKIESTIKFRPGLGIIQPLLFTAVKYRHARWRRRAIALLAQAGIEGPWIGRVEGTIARRVMEVEEESFDGAHENITPEMIPERKRISGTHLHDDAHQASTKTNILCIELSRCVDVEYMVGGKEGFENPKHWNIWQENVDMINDDDVY